MRRGTSVHFHSHTPSADPFRRRVVGRLGRYGTSRSQRLSLSLARRDQLTNLSVDVHRVLTVRPTLLVERLVLDVAVWVTSCSVVPLIFAVRARTDCTNLMLECRVAMEPGMSPARILLKDVRWSLQ